MRNSVHVTPATTMTTAMGADAFTLLTIRQSQIMDEVAAGLTNKEIARKLGLSPSTVKSHILFIYQKTRYKNRIQLALHWVQYCASVGRVA